MNRKTFRNLVALFLAAMLGMFVAACSMPTDGEPKETKQSVQAENIEKEVAVEPETEGQKIAREKAEDLIELMPLSKDLLVMNLQTEGYPQEDIDYAVTHIDVSWTRQAERAAQNYVENMQLNETALHDQLEFDGFNKEQVAAGMKAAGF